MIDWLQGAELFDLWMRFAVVAIRIGGLFIFLPILSSSMIQMRLRIAIAGVLAMALMPLVALPDLNLFGPVDWGLLAFHELTVGFGLGLAARMIFSGVESASAIVAGQSGFAIASMVDPSSGDPSIIPATFHMLQAIALFLSADLHHLFIKAAIASYETMPVAAMIPHAGGLEPAASMLGTRMLTVAIELAAPALIISIAGDLVMVLVGKAMPQVPILMVAYPLKMALGMAAMVVLSISIGNAIGWLGRALASDASRLLAAVAGQ